MKRKITAWLLLCLILLLTGCQKAAPAPTVEPTNPASLAEVELTPAPTPVPTPTPTPKPVSPEVRSLEGANAEAWREMQRREEMEGRLVIPSANINVALFSGGTIPAGDYSPEKLVELMRQAITDNVDSALIYNDGVNIIADHSNQDFSTLSLVSEGDPGYILAGERIVSLRCNLVTNGTNTGYGITDSEGKPLPDTEDYVCYTCLEDWTHVLIVGFVVEDEDYYRLDALEQATMEAEPSPAATPVVTPAPSFAPAPTETPAPTAEQDAPPVYYEQPPQNQDIFASDLPFGAGTLEDAYGYLG